MIRKHPVRPYLRVWREKLGRTLEWVAGEIGTSHSTVQRYESGQSGVDNKTFAAIAEAYGLSVAELSAHPDHQEKAKALNLLHTAVQKLDAESIKVVAALAERLKPS